jgi:hypothetical protein
MCTAYRSQDLDQNEMGIIFRERRKPGVCYGMHTEVGDLTQGITHGSCAGGEASARNLKRQKGGSL